MTMLNFISQRPTMKKRAIAHSFSAANVVGYRSCSGWRAGMRGCLCLSIMLFLCLSSNAQQLYDGNQNLPPFGSFTGSDFDVVSLQNGNIHIAIPLLTVKQRGSSLTYKYIYDTPAYTGVWVAQPIPNHPKNGTWEYQRGIDYTGWRLSTPFQWSLSSPPVTQTCANQPYTIFRSYVVQDPEGAKHPLPILRGGTGVTTPCGDTLAGPALDGSGIWASVTDPYSGTITLKDGTIIPQPSQQLEDSNGNIATSSADTLNRNLLTVTNGSNVTYTSPLGKQYSGPSSTSWMFKDSNGTSQEYQLTYQLIDIASYSANIGTTNGQQLVGGPLLVPSTLTLPNALTYQFTFVENSSGQLQEITLPTGASISYAYNTGTGLPFSCTRAPNSGSYGNLDCRTHVTQRTVTQPGGSSATWKYNAGIVTDPYGNDEVHTFSYITIGTLTSSSTVETQVQNYSGCAPSNSGCTTPGPLLRTKVIAYTGEAGLQASSLINVRPISVTTTLDNGKVVQNQTDYETFTFTTNYEGNFTATRLNPTAYREYDFGSGAPGPLVRQTKYTYLSTGNSNYTSRNIVDRVLTKQILDGNSTQVALTTYEYDNYSHPNQPMVASGAVQHASSYSTSFLYRGNVTGVELWRNTDNSTLTTTKQYDDAGNIVSTIDPLGYKTSFDFTDSWTNSTCAPSGQGKAYLTKVTNDLNQATNKTYNSCTGSAASTTDPNGQVTSVSYDLLGRSTSVSYPDHGLTSYCYTDGKPAACGTSGNSQSAPFAVVTTSVISSSKNKISTKTLDGLGRVSQTQLNSEPDPSGVDYTLTTYDLLDRKSLIYNPTRCYPITTNCGEATWGFTTTNYDPLDRVISVVEQDGSTSSSTFGTAPPSGYNSYCTTVTDEAGKSRQSCVDGLGRITSVVEDPGSSPHLNYLTTYRYDALGNLTGVTQNGSNSSYARVRSFGYNSLSQLISATNPESGTISYAYDADGNVITKKAPSPNQPSTGTAQVSTTFTYDTLNRITGKTYADGFTSNPSTPTPFFGYDNSSAWGITQTNMVGRLWEAWTGTQSIATTGEIFSYDPMGRAVMNNQSPGVAVSNTAFGYSYDLAGDMTSASNGEGVTFTYSYDAAMRPTSVTSSYIDSQHPATLAAVNSTTGYYPNGALREITYANGLTRTSAYNNRLQPCRFNVNSSTKALATCSDAIPSGNVQDFNYGYSAGSSDNGDIASMLATGNQAFNRTYAYDALNRLSTLTDSASNQTCKGLSWGYDAWGNMTSQTTTSGSCLSFSAAANTQNRLVGYTYDAAGNMINDGSHSYYYDAENRLIQVDGTVGNCSSATACYTYSALGARLQKTQGSTSTYYLHDLTGRTVAQGTAAAGWQVGYVYLGDSLLAQYSADTTFFVDADHLGSTRLMTTLTAGVYDSMDYLPFGAQISGDTGTSHKFTGKERDSESGLDDFGARYFASSLGRFEMPDSGVDQHPVDPQSWNLYTYVRNNPLNAIDPKGEFTCGNSVTAQQCESAHISVELVARGLDKIKEKWGENSQEYKDAKRAIDALGDRKDNGVKLEIGDPGKGYAGNANIGANVAPTADNPNGQSITITLRDQSFSGSEGAGLDIAHEGSHAADASDWIASDFSKAASVNWYSSEMHAYDTEIGLAEALGHPERTSDGKYTLWNYGMLPFQSREVARTILKNEYHPPLDHNSKILLWQDHTRGGGN